MAHLMMPSSSLLALFLCALAALCRGEVVELTDLNFDDLVTTRAVWFIDVYAPWWVMSTHTDVDMEALRPCTDHVFHSSSCLLSRCSHCRELEPVWQEVARQLEGEVSVGKVRSLGSSGTLS